MLVFAWVFRVERRPRQMIAIQMNSPATEQDLPQSRQVEILHCWENRGAPPITPYTESPSVISDPNTTTATAPSGM